MYVSDAALLTVYFIVLVVTSQSRSFPENNHVADVIVSTLVCVEIKENVFKVSRLLSERCPTIHSSLLSEMDMW